MEMTDAEDEDVQLVVKSESHKAPVYVLDIMSHCSGLNIPRLLSVPLRQVSDYYDD